jgi:hypothetical protein
LSDRQTEGETQKIATEDRKEREDTDRMEEITEKKEEGEGEGEEERAIDRDSERYSVPFDIQLHAEANTKTVCKSLVCSYVYIRAHIRTCMHRPT